MRVKGRVREWREDKGFGFVEPMLTGPSVFVHIKAFSRPGRRPVVGDLVTYELGRDPSGRPRAERVEFSRASEPRIPVQQQSRKRPWAIPLAALTLAGLVAAWVAGKIPIFIPAVYVGMSVIAYVLYGWDKVSARGGRWRTKESTLLLAGLLGGWPGALIAQERMRHKTAKASFQTTFWGSVILNAVGTFCAYVADFSIPGSI